MHKICLTNDDGPSSVGMLSLADCLREFSELVVIVPDGQRSATGKSLTLNRPLRVSEHKNNEKFRMITHDGTPADSVVLATRFMDRIDLVVSGINAGGNIGYQSMFTSGTVGAVLEAAIKGYPAIAVSMESTPHEWFNPNGLDRDYSRACDETVDIVKRVLKNGLPTGIDALNLNFPYTVEEDSEVWITTPSRVRMDNDIERRTDPHGRYYYWLRGIEREGGPGSDVFAVLKEGHISLSPIVIETVGEDELDGLRQLMKK